MREMTEINMSKRVQEYENMGFGNKQILEICYGHESKYIKDEQVKTFTDPVFNWNQMYEIILGYEKLKDEQVKTFIDPVFNWGQMEQIRLGYEKLKDEQVKTFIDPNLTEEQMRNRRIAMEEENKRNENKR